MRQPLVKGKAEAKQTKMLIDGELVAGEGEALSILDPATGQEIASVPEATGEQVAAAMRGSEEAFETYCRTTPAERAGLLLDIAAVMDHHVEELAELESLDVGKPWPSPLTDEMPLTIDCFRFFAGAARTMSGSATNEYLAGHTSMIRRDPVGPVAAIAPWNYPLMMAAWKLAAPLAAGCPVVLKPSELTPLATLRLAELLADVLPKGLVNVLHGRGHTIGDRMINPQRSIWIGVTIMAPHVRYPDHEHPPEQVYLVASPGEFFHGDSGWFTPGPSGSFYNLNSPWFPRRLAASVSAAVRRRSVTACRF